jgi:glycine cleavage system H protein
MLYFSKDHEYIRVEGNIGTVGISNHAQNALGDVVFAEVPAIGKTFKQGAEIAVVESVKAASDVYAPVSGEVTAVNAGLDDNPALINEDSMGIGWFFKMKINDASELSKLMTEAQYQDYLNSIA